MFDEEQVKFWIKEALLNKGIITEEKSYSHKPHLADLPYDLNTNDLSKLEERVMATSRAMLRNGNKILQCTSELVDAIDSMETNDNKCKKYMEYATDNLKSLKTELNDYDGEYTDTSEYLQELCAECENVMPRVFDKYEKYLKKDNDERIKESIINDESKLKDLANGFGRVSYYNASFPSSYLTDNSRINKLSNGLREQIIEAVMSHQSSLNQTGFIKQKTKEHDSMVRIMNDYENHMDRISEKLGKLSNLSSDEQKRVDYMNRLIQQSKEDYHVTPFND